MRSFVLAAALFVGAHMAATGAAQAETVRYKATLTGAAETPPTNSKGYGNRSRDLRHRLEDPRVDDRLFRPDRPRGRRAFPWACACWQARGD